MVTALLMDVAALWSLRLVLLWCDQQVVFGKSFYQDLDILCARKCLTDCRRALRVFEGGQRRVRQRVMGELKQGMGPSPG